MKDLQISFIQSMLFWENPEENLRMFSAKTEALQDNTDLIILPEMFSTGFSMNPARFAQSMDGPSVSWMRETAGKKKCVLTGSLIISEKGNYYNRLIWAGPDGSIQTYDKRHLFRFGNEHEQYTSGSAKCIFEVKGWKIAPFICYDLRFPVWSRNRWKTQGITLQADYDLAIYVANWPERRSLPWKTLLAARAMENQAYVVGVNRTGTDGTGLVYGGDSAVHNYKGELLSKPNACLECIETITLSYPELLEFRQSFPVGLDADEFSL